MQRNCICGKKIAGRRELCPECQMIYGCRGDYPEWLKFLLADTKHEQRSEARELAHVRKSLDDPIPEPERASLIEKLDEDGNLILRGTYPTDGTSVEYKRVR